MMHRCSLFALLALVAGCAGGKQEQAPPAAAGDRVEGKFEVALLTPGPVTDGGWNSMAYKGLQAIEKELGATVNHDQTSPSSIESSMRAYAQKGYDLIIGHGVEYNAPGVALAKDYPNTVFVSSSGSEFAANAGALRFYLEQGFYLAGMLAAEMSKTGVVAMIGGDDVPSIRSTFNAFAAGAKAAKPTIRVLPAVFTGNGIDPVAAKQATLAVIAQGADMIIHQANNAAKGVFDAAAEKGVWAFGANADQSGESDAVLASAIIQGDQAYVALARRVKAGEYKGEVTFMGLDVGAVDFVINPKHRSKIPEAVLLRLEETRERLEKGELIAPRDEF